MTEKLELDLDKWIGVFWFGANSQAMQIRQDPKEKLSTIGAYIAYEEDFGMILKK